MRHHPLNRRTVFGGVLAAAALGASGCRGSDWYPSEISPDESLLRSVIAEKRSLISRYTTLIDGGQGDDPALYEEFRQHHARHLAVLEERLPGPGSASPSPSAHPDPDGGVRGLRVAEEAAAANRLRQLSEVTDPSLAQLFTSIGACEAGHAHLLSEA